MKDFMTFLLVPIIKN